ncbi:MAG: hypothetical protein J6B91_10675 [Prevotella sp.]|nr:hypothetical protein [Prevotella sp.]
MNVSSGGLSFDFSATNDNLVRIVEQSKQEIQTLADASKTGGKAMDAAFKQAADRLDAHAEQMSSALSTQRQAVMALEKEMEQLKAKAGQQFEAGDLAASQASMEVYRAKERELQKRRECIQACYDGFDVLEQERQRLEGLRQSSETAGNAQASLRSQLRQVREQLAQLEATEGVGVRQTEKFRELQAEAGRLADALADAQAQVRIFSDDNATITGAIAGLSGVAGAFSAAQGAMSLFGVENDKVQEAMLKVQSLMAITTGLQQVANALNKDSAFQLTIVRKAKDLLAASTNKLSVALGISTVAAKALMATLTLGLSVAITALVMLWDKYTNSTKEAAATTDETRKAFEEYHDSTAKKSADLVSKYEKLRREYSRLKTEADKTQWIKDNASAMDSLGLAVDGVTSADNIFVKNTAKVIKALELRAKAMALQELQTKAYEAYYSKIINADQTVAGGGYYTRVSGTVAPGSQGAKDLAAAMKAAGAVTRTGDAYNDGSWYSMSGGNFKLTQKAIDAINNYRQQQARATNQKIHAEAQTELDKTVNYTKQQLQLTEDEIASLNVLRAGGGGSGGGRNGGGTGGGSQKTEAELYADDLAKKKALYQKYLAWVTSSDATVREAAAQEFAPLLEQGSTYLDYLQRQQEALLSVAPTEAVKQKLLVIQNEIADATKEATLRNFQSQLEADLQACTTLGAMLDLLEQRRQAIAGDDTEVGDREREMIKSQEDDVKAQVKAETEALLQEYASYELERLKFAESYARKKELLERNLAAATTDEQRSTAKTALAALEEENQKWQKSKTSLYASLLEEYTTHQQKLADIQAKYAKQRAEAEANGNISMVQLINKKEQEEISKLAATQLMASDSWNKLFTDMERLGTTTIARLIKEVEANKVTLSAQLNPADLKAVNDQLERARQELQQRNPFLALRDSLAELRRAMTEKKLLADKDDPIIAELEERKKTYETIAAKLADPKTAPTVAVDFKSTLDEGADFTDYLKKRIEKLQGLKIKLGAEFTGQHELDVLIAMLNKVQGTGKSVGQGLKDSFSDAASSIQFISGCFDAVVGGMKKMGISMDEETEAILGDIGGIMEGAQNVAQGIATGNPLSIIQGSITLFSSAFDLFNSRDRKAEKSIKKHEQALGRLKNAYNELEHAIKTALGEEVYRNQTALIGNLRKQQAELTGMMADERSKKHTDNGKIQEWQEQYAELGRQISDIMDEITQSITQTTARDLAGNLADALVEAFEGGEDAAKAFGEVADDVIKKAVVNALKLQLLEKPLQNAIKQLQRDMGFDSEGNGTFDGLTEAEQKRFKQAVEAAGANFQRAMDMYKDLFAQLDESDPTTLSGAIKGASQESIDLLAGQTNAVRQNQVTQLALFRQQLIHVSNIDNNVGVIATRLLSILNALTSPAGTSLRSQGITD